MVNTPVKIIELIIDAAVEISTVATGVQANAKEIAQDGKWRGSQSMKWQTERQILSIKNKEKMIETSSKYKVKIYQTARVPDFGV